MSDYLQKLEELNKLKSEGVLTQQEFDVEKAKILKEGDHVTPPAPAAPQVIVNQNNSGCLKAALIIGAILLVLYIIGSTAK